MYKFKSFLPLSLIMFFAAFNAEAQRGKFDNLELQFGFKGFKAESGVFNFRYEETDSVSMETTWVRGSGQISSPLTQYIIAGGFEYELEDDWFLSFKGDVNLNNVRGGAAQIGAGYRYKLNYFLRLQPELMFSWGMITDTLGVASVSERPFIFRQNRFNETAEIHTFIRSQQYGLQPKLTLVADITDYIEFRFTYMYQIALVYNQAVVLKGEIIPGQEGKAVIPLREEFMQSSFENEPLEKPLFRPSGFSARAGFAIKLM